MSEIINRYFPHLTEDTRHRLSRLNDIYSRWNSLINVVSRKDMEKFMIHHVLHSLAIAKVFDFKPGMTVLDVGTGGGFPGIPLAIVFPGTKFTLLDSIEKKIRVVTAVAAEIGMENVIPVRKRVEEEKGSYNFITGRAVTDFGSFVKLTKKNVTIGEGNGIICLKGGSLDEELKKYSEKVKLWNIGDYFSEAYFETKKIVYLPSSFF